MSQVHYGHVFHVAGRPTVTEAAAALVDIPDGALVVDGLGRIVFCGSRSELPAQFGSARVQDHRPAYLLPGFVDTHVHYPQIYAGDSNGGGQLLEWLNHCIFPSESRFADPEFAARAAVEFCNRRIAAGTTAAMVFGSAFPHPQDALFTETQRRGLRIVSGRGIQTVGPATAAPLLTSEHDAIRLTRDEIDKWHAADTGAASTALLHVAIVPRFSLSVTTETLRNLGELYDSVRDRGVDVHSHLNEDNRPTTGEIDMFKKTYRVDSYLDTYDGKVPAGVGGERQESARPTHDPRALRPLRGCRVGAHCRNGNIDIALSGIAIVPGIRNHAVETHRGRGREHLGWNGCRWRRRVVDSPCARRRIHGPRHRTR